MKDTPNTTQRRYWRTMVKRGMVPGATSLEYAGYLAQANNLMHVLDAVDLKGDPVFAVLKINADVGHYRVHIIKSAYGKENFTRGWQSHERHQREVVYVDRQEP